MNTDFGYLVIDSRTGRIVSRCKTRIAANRSADRRDNEYGAYRYRVRVAMPSESKAFKAQA